MRGDLLWAVGYNRKKEARAQAAGLYSGQHHCARATRERGLTFNFQVPDDPQ
jgi:hypothetical protein